MAIMADNDTQEGRRLKELNARLKFLHSRVNASTDYEIKKLIAEAKLAIAIAEEAYRTMIEGRHRQREKARRHQPE